MGYIYNLKMTVKKDSWYKSNDRRIKSTTTTTLFLRIFDTGGLEIPIAAGKIVQINGTSPEWIFTFIVGLRVSSQSLLDWTNDAL